MFALRNPAWQNGEAGRSAEALFRRGVTRWISNHHAANSDRTPTVQRGSGKHPRPFRAQGVASLESRQLFGTDSDLGQLALIRAACGIGVCQVRIAKRDPSLVRVLPRHFELRLDTWVTMHAGLRSSPRCKVTFDALVRGLGRMASSKTG